MPVVPLIGNLVRSPLTRRPAAPRRARRRIPQTPRARGAARARPTARPLLAGGARVLSRAFGPVATVAVALGGAVVAPLIGDYLARRILQRPGLTPTPFPKGPAARSRPRPAPQPAPGTSPIEEITVSAPRPRPLAPPRTLPLSFPRVMPLAFPVPRLSPLLDPRLVPQLRSTPRPSSRPPRAGPTSAPRVLSPRDFLPDVANPLLTPLQAAPVRLPAPRPTPTPSPQPQTQPERCVQTPRKPRKKGKCEEGFYRERPTGTTFKPWRTRKCR